MDERLILDDGDELIAPVGVPLERLNEVNIKIAELDRLRERLQYVRTGGYAYAVFSVLYAILAATEHAYLQVVVTLVVGAACGYCGSQIAALPRDYSRALLLIFLGVAVMQFLGYTGGIMLSVIFIYVGVSGYRAAGKYVALRRDLRRSGVSATHLSPADKLEFVDILRVPTA